MNLLVRFLVNAAALWVAARLVPGIEAGGVGSVLAIALVFGVLNALIKPFLTLGLFTLVVNAAMLMLTAWFGGKLGIEFRVEGFWAAFLGALLVSIVSTLLSWLLSEKG
jgi:putative membrane protein